MATFVVRLSDLLPPFRDALEQARLPEGWDSARLQAAVKEAFGFLGAFTTVDVDGDAKSDREVIILQFTPPEGRDLQGAEKRFRRATNDAEIGRFATALPGLTRLVEEFPEVGKYHRALGQLHLVQRNFDLAEDALLRSLSLEPADADSLTLLGNLYVQRGRPAEAIPLYERSIALGRSVYALNNLGAALAEVGETDRALATLRAASEEDPKYPNTWFGIGLALSRLERLDVLPEALSALDTCLGVIGRRQSSPTVWDAAQGLLDGLTQIEAREEVASAQQAIRRTLASLTADSNAEVRLEEQPLNGVLAKLEVAWVHERPFHRLIVTPTQGPEREHHILHELQHLQLINSARASGKNRWFGSAAAGREKALRTMATEIARIERLGLPHDTIVEMTNGSLHGLLSQLFNFPIDLLIETRLQATYPQLKELFYRSIKSQLALSASLAQNVQLQKATPKQIFRANVAMNGAFALWFEDRYPRRTDLVSRFQKSDAWSLAKRLYASWSSDSQHWTPGSEYTWIDHWAEVLGLRDWYTWTDGNATPDQLLRFDARNDSGFSRLSTSPSSADATPDIGASEPLDPVRSMAAMSFMLDALRWADQAGSEQASIVAAQAAMTGQHGIAYLDPDSRYSLSGFSNEPISGLQLLSVMYVLIKRLDPALDQGIDLEGPYQAAEALHEQRKRRGEL